jgi:hypothetical protein
MTQSEIDVLAERQRQIEMEGWTAEHDDLWTGGELASAGVAYALASHEIERAPMEWPWDKEWWKPKNRRRNLVRAAALIIADIDRMDRTQVEPEGYIDLDKGIKDGSIVVDKYWQKNRRNPDDPPPAPAAMSTGETAATPNAVTRRVMEETETGRNVVDFDSPEEMMAELDRPASTEKRLWRCEASWEPFTDEQLMDGKCPSCGGPVVEVPAEG